MHAYRSQRRCGAEAFLFLFVLFGGAISPKFALAAGALAVGLPADVAKGGFTYGYSNGNDTSDTASERALKACRTTKDAAKNERLRSLCKVIQLYSDKCVAVAMDPLAGTPGVGWAVADDRRAAEKQALSQCEKTAGPGRAAACVVDHSGCDGTAQDTTPPK